MARLTTKNWAEFQHYKDRSPPWIKLHKELLDDRKYQSLPLASRALAPMLWLLASESKDGSFDGDTEELAFRLRAPIKEVVAGLQPLIDKGFFLVASKPLADGSQPATPEGEGETEGEQKKPTRKARATSLPENFEPSERVKVWATEKGFSDIAPHFDAFVSYVKRKGATYVDWDEALMTAVRNDWGKTGGKPAATSERFV